MSAYTAGPWRIREDGTVQQDGSKHLWICAPIDIPRREGGENATVANSTLIAAAPELYELVKGMRSYFHSFAKDGVRPDEWIMQEWVRKCDKAIAKAEGK